MTEFRKESIGIVGFTVAEAHFLDRDMCLIVFTNGKRIVFKGLGVSGTGCLGCEIYDKDGTPEEIEAPGGEPWCYNPDAKGEEDE